MPPKFYRQEKGLLIRPTNVYKFHIAWSLDNILEGFKHFHKLHARWPIYLDLENCEYLPNMRTIQRSFGGVKNIRAQLGLAVVDLGRGEARSETARKISSRALRSEDALYKILVDRFFEPFVHVQAGIIHDQHRMRVDFLIYHSGGKFAVDIFTPQAEWLRLSNNIAAKYKNYEGFPFRLYLCVGNRDVTDGVLKENSRQSWTKPSNIILISYDAFLRELFQYSPLSNPL